MPLFCGFVFFGPILMFDVFTLYQFIFMLILIHLYAFVCKTRLTPHSQQIYGETTPMDRNIYQMDRTNHQNRPFIRKIILFKTFGCCTCQNTRIFGYVMQKVMIIFMIFSAIINRNLNHQVLLMEGIKSGRIGLNKV
jgi:hypothetical protein